MSNLHEAQNDRITHLHVKGLRCIDDLSLSLDGLMVLIGENGSGKSSILQALHLLSCASRSVEYCEEVIQSLYGGIDNLLRFGCNEMTLAISAKVRMPDETHFAEVKYGIVVERARSGIRIRTERLTLVEPDGKHVRIINREGQTVHVLVPTAREPQRSFVAEGSLVLLQLGLTAHWAAVRVVQLLDGIQVHVPFEVRPHWQLHERALGESPRRRVKAHTVSRLDRYGFNLANCLMNLRNRRESWDALLLELRVVLGQHFTDFHLFVDNGFQVVRPVFDGIERDLDVLSEGQLGYLLHCVMLRLPPTGVVAIDEPELHLHPSMVARLAWRFEFAAESRCVLVATHSATFLDQLTEPAKSVYVCRLREADSAMEIVRLDAVRLQEWLTDYRGVGELADTGHLVHVLEQAATPTESPRGAAE